MKTIKLNKEDFYHMKINNGPDIYIHKKLYDNGGNYNGENFKMIKNTKENTIYLVCE